MRLFTATLLLALPAATPAIIPGWDTPDIARLVQPIITTIHYSDGAEQRNRGSGFVVGEQYFTAYHNIQATSADIASYRIELGGHAVRPLAVDIVHDLAAFEIPRALCASWCNELVLESSAPGAVSAVSWIRLEGGDLVWKHAGVSNLAFKSPLPSGAGNCDDNLVVEIDQPFVPGSSGGPVFDATSGAIVGLIQGSFENRLGRVTGYYKPLQCVLSRLASK